MKLKTVWKVDLRIKDIEWDGRQFDANSHYVMADSIELAVGLVREFYTDQKDWSLVRIDGITLESFCGIA